MIDAVPAYVLLLGHIAAVGCGIAAVRAMPPGEASHIRARPMLLTGLAVGYLALAALTFLAVDPSYFFWDFRSAYYPAGRAVLIAPGALGELVAKGVYGFVNLPIVAYLFAPLGMVSLRYAIGLFTVLGLGVAVAAWLLLVNLANLKGMERWLLLLLFVADSALQYSIKEGNTSHWVLAGLAGGLYLLRRNRQVAAGVLLGLAAVIKLPLLLFGVYFVLRRDWRATFAFAATGCVLGALSVAVFGWDFHVRWFELCVRPFSNQWIPAFNVQSIQSFVFRLQAAPELLRDWTAHPPAGSERLAAYILVGLLYLTTLWAGIRGAFRGQQSDAGTRRDLEFLLIVCLALVTSPLSWSHYYTWLLLPAAFFIGSKSPFPAGTTGRAIGWLAIVLSMLLIRPLHFTDPTLETFYVTAGASFLLFSALLWIGLLTWSLARVGQSSSSLVSATTRDLPASVDPRPVAAVAGHNGPGTGSNIIWTRRRQGSVL